MATPARRPAKVLGRQVAEQRARLGLSRPGLAAKLGIDRTYLWRIETGATLPGSGLIFRLADFFGITVDELRGRKRAA